MIFEVKMKFISQDGAVCVIAGWGLQLGSTQDRSEEITRTKERFNTKF